MTTARDIITDALTFYLNKLSPGEALDADTAAACLDALNHVWDEQNGGKGLLFKEVRTASGSTISSATALLGTAWATLSPGDEILGATYSDGSQDIVIDRITMQQYHQKSLKTTSGDPCEFAHDGLATLYFYPVPTGRTVTLLTKAPVAEFADLDTDYSMPKGYKAASSVMVAEVLAPLLNPSMVPILTTKASMAKTRLAAQTIDPAILCPGEYQYDIRRGY